MKNKYFLLFLILFLSLSSILFAEDDVFTISTSNNNLRSNPDCDGMLDRIMIEIFHRLGYPCRLVYTQTGQPLIDVNAGVLDCESNRIEGIETLYPNLIRVPDPNVIMHFVAFSKKQYPIENWESLKDLRIGIIRGWKILERNTEGFEN